MNMPIEETKYMGEEAGIGCPLCHCNVLLVPENLPYIYCPICAIRGTIVVNKDKMTVEWNMNDVKLPRFSFEGELHHFEFLAKDGERRRIDQAATEAMKASIIAKSNSFAKVVTPPA